MTNPDAATEPTATGAPRRPVNVGARFADGYRALEAIEASLAEGPIPLSTRELVKIRASQINGCAYCLDMHTRDALDAGEDPVRLGLIAAWWEATAFTPAERAALAVAEAITRIADGPVPPEVEVEARRHYDDNAYAALVFTAITINAWNRVALSSHAVPGSSR